MATFSKDILRDCDNAPIAGIKQRLLLINTEDLPISGITFDTLLKREKITKIELNPTKRGYEVQSLKQLISYDNSFIAPEGEENGFRHTVAGIRLSDPSAETRKQINELKCGANLYAVLERNWKGSDLKSAFLFFGTAFGLELSELNDKSNENDGAITISLATPVGFKEPYVPPVLLDTDYATTMTAFNNKFLAPSIISGKLAATKDIGTTTVQGTIINTSETVELDILTVVNTYLTTPITATELGTILTDRATYKWALIVGDNRNAVPAQISRIVDITNWSGEDVTNKALEPGQIDGNDYNFVLTFNGTTKKMKIKDSHSNGASLYGAIRGLRITLA